MQREKSFEELVNGIIDNINRIATMKRYDELELVYTTAYGARIYCEQKKISIRQETKATLAGFSIIEGSGK